VLLCYLGLLWFIFELDLFSILDMLLNYGVVLVSWDVGKFPLKVNLVSFFQSVIEFSVKAIDAFLLSSMLLSLTLLVWNRELEFDLLDLAYDKMFVSYSSAISL